MRAVHDVREENLKRNLKSLIDEVNALEDQKRNEINEANRVRLNRSIDSKYKEMKEIQEELNKIEEENSLKKQHSNNTNLNSKSETNDFDVFLCHNSNDKEKVKRIALQLKEQGVKPWLDEWELRPGFRWQKVLEEQIKQIKSAAVFVGKSGFGPWQDMEQKAFLRQFVNRQLPVIPVILSDCKGTPELPVFLEGMTWVDFRKRQPDPLKQLIWGIKGKRSK